MENSREMVRWAFEAEVGAISQPFEFGDKFAVAHLKEIREAGTLSLDVPSIKERVKREVIVQKKAEKFKELMKGFNSLEDAANKLGKEIETAENVSFGAYSIPGLGSERKLLGAAYGAETGTLSGPIADKKGVYLFVVDEKSEVPPADNYYVNRSQLSRNYSSRVDYEVFSALEKSAKIVDNRAKFY